MEDEINRLRDMLAQLPLHHQQRLVPQFMELVEWFSKKTDEMGAAEILRAKIAFEALHDGQGIGRIGRERERELLLDDEDFEIALASRRAARLEAEAHALHIANKVVDSVMALLDKLTTLEEARQHRELAQRRREKLAEAAEPHDGVGDEGVGFDYSIGAADESSGTVSR